MRCVSPFGVVALLAACGGSPPAAQAKKEAQSLISSAATIRMTAQAWLSGAVPDAFTDNTLQKVEQSLQQEPKKIISQPLPPDARSTLMQAAGAMQRTVGAIRTAVQQRKPSTLAPHLQQLAGTEQRLLALERARGGQ